MMMPLVNSVMGLLPINPLRVLAGAGKAIAAGKASQPAETQDTARFSQLARLSNAAAKAGVPLGEGRLEAGELERMREEYLAEFKQELGNLFRDKDIDDSEAIVLQRGYGGYLRVVNDHPQRFEIEAALEQDPKARELFQKIEAVSNLLDAVRATGSGAGYGRLSGDAPARMHTMFTHATPFTLRYEGE